MENGTMIFILAISAIVLVLLLIFAGISIVPQGRTVVIERIGQYKGMWEPGIHWRMPIIDRIVLKVSVKEQVLDFDPQDVITSDNVTMKLDAVVFFKIVDAKLYAYGAENPERALYNLTSTTTRNIIGELSLDETLTSRDTMNERLRAVLDEATDPWGIKVSRVEVKNLIPPESVKEAMEAQMRAERERRAVMISAEGEKKSNILRSEGYKQAEILRAEGDAQAVRLKYDALADAIERVNQAKPSKQAMHLETLKTLEKVADGRATKLILPSELSSIANLAGVVGESLGFKDATEFNTNKPTKKSTSKKTTAKKSTSKKAALKREFADYNEGEGMDAEVNIDDLMSQPEVGIE